MELGGLATGPTISGTPRITPSISIGRRSFRHRHPVERSSGGWTIINASLSLCNIPITAMELPSLTYLQAAAYKLPQRPVSKQVEKTTKKRVTLLLDAIDELGLRCFALLAISWSEKTEICIFLWCLPVCSQQSGEWLLSLSQLSPKLWCPTYYQWCKSLWRTSAREKALAHYLFNIDILDIEIFTFVVIYNSHTSQYANPHPKHGTLASASFKPSPRYSYKRVDV